MQLAAVVCSLFSKVRQHLMSQCSGICCVLCPVVSGAAQKLTRHLAEVKLKPKEA